MNGPKQWSLIAANITERETTKYMILCTILLMKNSCQRIKPESELSSISNY